MNRKIFLLAGHHLKDPGAVANGYQENRLTIEVRELIAKRIRQLAPEVPIWLDDDKDTLSQVIGKVNKLATSNDILFDIHFNSFTDAKATGSEAFVHNNASQLSRTIAGEASKWAATILGIQDRGVKTEQQAARGRLGILYTPANNVLLEVGFLSNPNDMAGYEKWKHWMADEQARLLIRNAAS